MRFRIADLPERTKLLFDIQKTMREKIFKKTLANQKSEIEDMLSKLNIYSVWTNILQENSIARQMIPEIFIDSSSSILFGCFGLYKYAYMCMRSELETALRLIFFRDHPMEFKWWLDGKIWWPGGNTSQVWGRDYTYFQRLEKIKMFDDSCPPHLTLFKENNTIRQTYKLLSNYIHTGAKNFQTSPDRISPSYNLGKFNIWVGTWKTVESQVNILLSLGFYEELLRQTPDIHTVIKHSIDPRYHAILDEILFSDE